MDIVKRLREVPVNTTHWVKCHVAADEIERLRSQMDLFDPSTTQEMAAAALNFANDEIKRLQERNHALRKANKRLGEIATDAVGWLPPASVNGPREEYQNEIKELTDGHC